MQLKKDIIGIEMLKNPNLVDDWREYFRLKSKLMKPSIIILVILRIMWQFEVMYRILISMILFTLVSWLAAQSGPLPKVWPFIGLFMILAGCVSPIYRLLKGVEY